MNDNNPIQDNEEGTYHPIVALLNTLINNDIITIIPVNHIPQLAGNDDSHALAGVSGVSGVSVEFINNLDEFIVSDEFARKEIQCSICFDDFKEGDKCIELPCSGKKHVFHNSEKCSVIPWLERNNTCPMCRHEFPKEDETQEPIERQPDYVIMENTITSMIEGYINEIRSTEESDLQRAIELSLNDN